MRRMPVNLLIYDMTSERKYSTHECQDEEINRKFRVLHLKVVNEIISFCKENDFTVDEFYLHADGLDESIKNGEWHPYTDSQFELLKDIEGRDKQTFLFSA